MKLIREVRLSHRKKIYKIYLQEVVPGEFVVNFRYGRKKQQLKEGTKTSTHVSYQEATSIFEALCQTQLDKGYIRDKDITHELIAVPSAPAPSLSKPARRPSASTPAPAARKPKPGAVPRSKLPKRRRFRRRSVAMRRLKPLKPQDLKGLSEAELVTYIQAASRTKFKLNHLLWKAGLLGAKTAAPHILAALARTYEAECFRAKGKRDAQDRDVRRYLCLYALGRAQAPEAEAQIEAIYKSPDAAGFVRRIAGEALRRIYEGRGALDEFSSRVEGALRSLPDLHGAYQKKDTRELKKAMKSFVGAHTSKRVEDALNLLYLLDSKPARAVVLEQAALLPFSQHFRALRSLLKSAEFRRDGELFGIIAHRIELARGIRYPWHERYKHRGARYKGFSVRTRDYLVNWTWKTLDQLGQHEDPGYVDLAAGYLARFEAPGGQESTPRQARFFEAYFGYFAFNKILYGGTDKVRFAHYGEGDFFKSAHLKSRQQKPLFELDEPAYAEQWGARPSGLMTLIGGARCAPVCHFAVKQLMGRGLTDHIDERGAISLLESPFRIAQELGLSRARALFELDKPSARLLVAALESDLAAAHQLGREWLDGLREALRSHSKVLIRLLKSKQKDVRELGYEYVRRIDPTEEAAEAIYLAMLERMLKSRNDDLFAEIEGFLRRQFAERLYQLPPSEAFTAFDDTRSKARQGFALRWLEGAIERLPVHEDALFEGLSRRLFEADDERRIERIDGLLWRGFEARMGELDAKEVLKALHCGSRRKGAFARRWFEATHATLQLDAKLIVQILAGADADSRRWGRGFVKGLSLEFALASEITVALVERTLRGKEALLEDLKAALLEGFAAHLHEIREEVALDLLTRSDAHRPRLAAAILLARVEQGLPIAEETLLGLLDFGDPEVRVTGLTLMSKMPDAALAKYRALIVALSIHSDEVMRDGSRLVVQRIARSGEGVEGLAVELVGALLRQKLPEGAAAHLVSVLSQDLRAVMDKAPKPVIMRLLGSRRDHAQELGGMLLLTALKPEQLTLDEIARFGAHKLAVVRRAGWGFYGMILDRLKADITTAVRIIDSDWEDTRQFAFGLFGGDQFCAEDFPPNVLVSLCDSTREDVQRFGQGLLTRFFDEAFGPEYMLKLSEHPSVSMQRFVTHYLERYAAGSPERLEQMRLYFIVALSRVNRGGFTKRRLFSFFAQEAQASRGSAEVIAEILARQSATNAVMDRAAAIEIMLQIHRDWPDVSLPIKVRDAVGV